MEEFEREFVGAASGASSLGSVSVRCMVWIVECISPKILSGSWAIKFLAGGHVCTVSPLRDQKSTVQHHPASFPTSIISPAHLRNIFSPHLLLRLDISNLLLCHLQVRDRPASEMDESSNQWIGLVLAVFPRPRRLVQNPAAILFIPK